MDWPEDWTHNDLSDQERCLLMQMEFYPWGGGHWCTELDGEGGGTCYDDAWAVERALEFGQDRNPCAEDDCLAPAMTSDFLCLWHRRGVKGSLHES